MLAAMLEADASGSYVMISCPPLLRMQGVNRPWATPPLTAADTEALADSVMNADERAAFRATKEMNLGMSIEGLGRFRVNVLRQRGSVGMVIRQIKSKIPSLADLQLPSAATSSCEGG